MQLAHEKPTDYEKHYKLPDGQDVTLGAERFRVPECLFQPLLLGKEAPGLHESVINCVQGCELDVRRDLFRNLVLSGGNTMFPGIAERLTSEIKQLAPMKVDVKVNASPARRYLVWHGASIVSRLSCFSNLLIWKSEFDEHGSGIVHRKCF